MAIADQGRSLMARIMPATALRTVGPIPGYAVEPAALQSLPDYALFLADRSGTTCNCAPSNAIPPSSPSPVPAPRPLPPPGTLSCGSTLGDVTNTVNPANPAITPPGQYPAGWEDWAAQYQLTIDWNTRMVLGTTQPMPTHLEIPDVDAAARLCGQDWPQRLARGRHRLSLARASFPLADHSRIVRAADPMSDTDFGLLLEAAQWFASNTAAGLTPRQVPLPGFHGKWLNCNQPLICALTGKDDLGLVHRPTRVHFTYLDSEHRASGGRYHEHHDRRQCRAGLQARTRNYPREQGHGSLLPAGLERDIC